MDHQRFDFWTRRIASNVSRRGVVKALAGGAVGAVLARLGAEAAAAKCVKLRQRCAKGDRCCGGARCAGGRCKCPGSRQTCKGRCIPTTACCGGCPSGQRCAGGTCVAGQGTCATGADSCATPNLTCNTNADCWCLVSTEGDTRCANSLGPGTVCGECADSAECQKIFPDVPGVFCARTTVDDECCFAGPRNMCKGPCPS